MSSGQFKRPCKGYCVLYVVRGRAECGGQNGGYTISNVLGYGLCDEYHFFSLQQNLIFFR